MDSIIRQSRHQFGNEKDFFAGRFARNLQTTFVHLYQCPAEDKAKVIRVLNLWQRNKIFLPEVIQPLFLADPNNPISETVQAAALMSENLGVGEIHSNNNSKSQSAHQQQQLQPQVGLSQNTLAGIHASEKMLNKHEVLRQLQTSQEQMTAVAQAQVQQQQQQQQQQQMAYMAPEQERPRKLAESSKQEATFDQRLAQAVAVSSLLPFIKITVLVFNHINYKLNIDFKTRFFRFFRDYPFQSTVETLQKPKNKSSPSPHPVVSLLLGFQASTLSSKTRINYRTIKCMASYSHLHFLNN